MQVESSVCMKETVKSLTSLQFCRISSNAVQFSTKYHQEIFLGRSKFIFASPEQQYAYCIKQPFIF